MKWGQFPERWCPGGSPRHRDSSPPLGVWHSARTAPAGPPERELELASGRASTRPRTGDGFFCSTGGVYPSWPKVASRRVGLFVPPESRWGPRVRSFFREFHILSRRRRRPCASSTHRVGVPCAVSAHRSVQRMAVTELLHPAPARAFSVFSGRGHRGSSCHAEHTLPSTAGP